MFGNFFICNSRFSRDGKILKILPSQTEKNTGWGRQRARFPERAEHRVNAGSGSSWAWNPTYRSL